MYRFLTQSTCLLVCSYCCFATTQLAAAPFDRQTAATHAAAARTAIKKGNWIKARTEWFKAIKIADLAKLESKRRATYYYEYGKIAGITCQFDVSEKFLNKAYELNKENSGPWFLALVEFSRLYKDRNMHKKAIQYFKRALPALQQFNALAYFPGEYAMILEEYASSLNTLGEKNKANELLDSADILRKKYAHKITHTFRIQYGAHCDNSE